MGVVQYITINHIRINGISNSSVFQIGTAGLIKPLSNLYNTGGFTEAAPTLGAEIASTQTESETPLIPFAGGGESIG